MAPPTQKAYVSRGLVVAAACPVSACSLTAFTLNVLTPLGPSTCELTQVCQAREMQTATRLGRARCPGPQGWDTQGDSRPPLQAAGPSPNQCSPVSLPKPSRYASQPRKKFTEPSSRR